MSELLTQARAFLEQGLAEPAVQICQSVLAADPQSAEAYFLIAHAAMMAEEKVAAFQLFERACELEPANMTYPFAFAHALITEGRFAEADQLADQITAADPMSELGWQLKLDVGERTGAVENRFECWRNMLDLQDIRWSMCPDGDPGIRYLNSHRGVLERIGETASQLDTFIKLRLLGWRPDTEDRILANPTDVVNPAYLDYWRPHLDIISDPAEIERQRSLSGWLTYHSRFFRLPSGDVVHKDQAYVAAQREWEIRGQGPLLRLTGEHRMRGREELRRRGVPENAWFVTLHNREPGYIHGEAEYQAFRDAAITDFLPAIRTIVDRGGWVVRVGDETMTPLPAMDGVIDYALSDWRSDWMDVFLFAGCRFFLGSTSGPHLVAETFGVPVVITNLCPISYKAPSKQDLFLPKLYRQRSNNRLLPLEMFMEPPFYYLMNGEIYDQHGIEVVDNQPEEIVEAVEEMLDRLDGRLAYDTGDRELQRRYDHLFHREANYIGRSRVGRAFGQRYQDLLPRLAA